MVLINKAVGEMTLKVVYYGPGLCGKTTNLQCIHDKSNPDRRGKLLSIATETDRTLFFDLLPIDLGSVRGMKVRVQLYTVPGQVFYDATRRLVLRGADGVVFVADSQEAMMDANVESVKNLQENLIKNNLNPRTIPLIFQFNKRDLPNISTCEDLNNALRYRLDTPYFEAVAIDGRGVNETLKAAVSAVIKNLNKGVSCELEPGAKPAVELGPGMKKKRAAKPAPEARAAKKPAKAAQAPGPAGRAASSASASPAPETNEIEVEEEGEEKYDDLSQEVAEIEAEEIEELPEDADEGEPEEANPAPQAASPILPEEIDASDREEYLRSLYESNKRQLALIEEALKTLQQEQAILEKLLKS